MTLTVRIPRLQARIGLEFLQRNSRRWLRKRIETGKPTRKEPRLERMSHDRILNQKAVNRLQPNSTLKLPKKKGKSRKIKSNLSWLQRTLREHLNKYEAIAEFAHARPGYRLDNFGEEISQKLKQISVTWLLGKALWNLEKLRRRMPLLKS